MGPFSGIKRLAHYPLLAQNRMMPHGRALWLDGAPLLVRGICYSPVPVGHDPGYGEPWGDYFTTEYYEIFQRDIKLFVEMGANTIRLYTFKTSERHTFFLDAADDADLIVMGAFEIGTAEHTSLATLPTGPQQGRRSASRGRSEVSPPRPHTVVRGQRDERPVAGLRLRVVLRREVPDVRRTSASSSDNAVAHAGGRRPLRGRAPAKGMLCTTPLAGVSMPDKYRATRSTGRAARRFGPGGWVKFMEMNNIMKHLDVWSANLYPGRDFREFNFSDDRVVHAGRSSSPSTASTRTTSTCPSARTRVAAGAVQLAAPQHDRTRG